MNPFCGWTMGIRRLALAFVLAFAGCAKTAGPGAQTRPAAAASEQAELSAPADVAVAKDPVGSPKPPAEAKGPPSAPRPAPAPANTVSGPSARRPADPPRAFRPLINLSIFQYAIPAGAISRSEEFWKHVDEHAVDAYTYDILYKNGIRVGRAPLAEWDYFRGILERYPFQAKPALYATTSVKSFDLPMKLNVPQQTIFDFDSKNYLNIRSYDASDNVFAIEFQAAPRKRGDVRVTLCPKIITQRVRIVPRGDIDTDELEFVQPESMLQLSFWTDVALDQILIIAPSPDASAPMSVGHSFMMHEGNAQEMEQLLVLIPQALRLPEREQRPGPATTAAKAE
jgi:hypothetical protein